MKLKNETERTIWRQAVNAALRCGDAAEDAIVAADIIVEAWYERIKVDDAEWRLPSA